MVGRAPLSIAVAVIAALAAGVVLLLLRAPGVERPDAAEIRRAPAPAEAAPPPRLEDAPQEEAPPRREAAASAGEAGASGPPEHARPASALARLELHVSIEDGEPLAPANTVDVSIHALDGTAVSHASTTGPVGTVDVEPGAYRIVAEMRTGHIGGAYAEAEPGTTTRVDIALALPIVVEGVVRDARDGAPIAGARVSTWMLGPSRHVTTDAAGIYRFPWGVARAGMLDVAADGFGRERARFSVSPGGGWRAAVPRVLLPEEQDGRRIPVLGEDERAGASPPVSMPDVMLVPERTIEGDVVDESGRALAGARIVAAGQVVTGKGIASPDESPGESRSDGHFRVGGLRSDVTHVVRVELAAYATAYRTVAAAAGTDVVLAPIALAPERVIEGVVLDAAERPVAGVTVDATAVLGESATAEVDARFPRDIVRPFVEPVVATTDEHGAFRLAGLGDGTWRLRVLSAGDVRFRGEVLLEGADRVHVYELALED